MTTWRPVSGWHGFYEVSDEGQVRSVDRISFGKKHRGRILRPSSTPKGYKIAVLSGHGERRSYPVHRLVAESFLGPLPEGMHTMHLDGDNTNNRVSNLRYGTASENELDKVRHGRNPNANKTHCPQGHPYDAGNTFLGSKGDRRCRTCHREKKRAYDARRRAS